jgi:hypothetical protein
MDGYGMTGFKLTLGLLIKITKWKLNNDNLNFLNFNLNFVKVTDTAHCILACWSGGGLATSAKEPITAGVNEFWSGDRF